MQKKNSRKSVRLSTKVIPEKYFIELKPDLENFTFTGVETILLKISQQTKTLTLHSKDLEIQTAEIGTGDKKDFAKIKYDQANETATFSFAKNIPPGKIKIKIFFRGILNDTMRGFYRSHYFVDGQKHHLATTQFEATDARRAFPCFDEPAHKAIFYVSLIIPGNKKAISNTLPTSIIEHEAGYKIVNFAPTPKMSTYLLAFIVGDFEYIEKKSKRGVIIRAHTTPGKLHQAKFALDVAVRTLEFYEKYFDIPYPLNTLDMIAVPDFDSGAMENWGAITYRENALLVDDDHSSNSSKQWVALVVAHEIAHQWFGNLVTMEWWTHLWLNEGFASYIEYLAVDKIFPDWDIWTQFSTHDLGVALRLDSLASTHPIEIKVKHPNEIGEIFDAVSYSKGASIIRMLANYLGERDFRDGLRYYLKKHSYKNTETIHLWQAFEKVSRRPVAKMMQNWTSRPGYPVVKAEIKNKKITFSQTRFFSSPISKQKSKDKTKWEIPVTFKNNKVNFGETGFYRVAYSHELLEKLKKPIENKILGASDRLGVVRDLFALSEAGITPTTDALEFLGNYKKENNYTVWLEIASGLAQLEQIFAKNFEIKKNLDFLTQNLFSKLVGKYGWEKKHKESHTDTLLRSLAIARSGRSGDKKTIQKAQEKFALIKKGKDVSPDIRGAVYSIVATYGDMKEYNTLINKYKKETLHEEKNRIGAALGDFKNKKILEDVCKFAISDHVRIQDAVGIISSVASNPQGREVWFDFIKNNWKTLMSRYGGGGFTLLRLVKGIAGSAEAGHLQKFKTFFTTHDAPGAKRSVEQVIERLESNIAWLKRDKRKIEEYFRKN